VATGLLLKRLPVFASRFYCGAQDIFPGFCSPMRLIMTDKRENELQDVLKDGITALRAMRKGIADACGDLRKLYRAVSPSQEQRTAGGDVGRSQRAQELSELTSPRTHPYS
jgi:hypothetical protein